KPHQPASGFAIVGAAAGVAVDGSGKIQGGALGRGGVGGEAERGAAGGGARRRIARRRWRRRCGGRRRRRRFFRMRRGTRRRESKCCLIFTRLRRTGGRWRRCTRGVRWSGRRGLPSNNTGNRWLIDN